MLQRNYMYTINWDAIHDVQDIVPLLKLVLPMIFQGGVMSAEVAEKYGLEKIVRPIKSI